MPLAPVTQSNTRAHDGLGLVGIRKLLVQSRLGA